MRKVLYGLGLVMGLYLIGRAIAEPFNIDMSDPATYRDDWGGPGLPGVLLAHCGPGVLSAIIIVAVVLRRRSRPASSGR
ncbi:hypothetical protein Cs7R123_11220 [Catellatospora sp. TT07R-123]|uniref:hypothetical protein n=1 Tax=Catellatospora sp. TT07R-123 TaxID=2733863 RepID=UPI001AFF5A14|nr:hypothetical protein [Catellatospora sp. TT07R-123]GHJ43780.1 hypothetical protein Cs7R123_11220 [Catellatospora sp. TT07R-123]